MAKVRIVTDSTARFENPRFVHDYDVKVVPNTVKIGDQEYRENNEHLSDEILQQIRHNGAYPKVFAPSVGVFEDVYRELAQTTDQICVMVHSQNFTSAYANAQSARSAFLGRCDIAVIDSRSSSAGLGYLVEAAAEVAETRADLDEVVRVARGIVPRLYTVMYVDSLEFIRNMGLVGDTQSMLGTMLEIKPLLTIEDGILITMEKARTHSQAIDKMIEFVAEFTQIERLCILQDTIRVTDKTRILQDRLALEFSRLQSPVMIYEPLTASQIGPDGLGMVVLEGDGFYQDK